MCSPSERVESSRRSTFSRSSASLSRSATRTELPSLECTGLQRPHHGGSGGLFTPAPLTPESVHSLDPGARLGAGTTSNASERSQTDSSRARSSPLCSRGGTGPSRRRPRSAHLDIVRTSCCRRPTPGRADQLLGHDEQHSTASESASGSGPSRRRGPRRRRRTRPRRRGTNRSRTLASRPHRAQTPRGVRASRETPRRDCTSARGPGFLGRARQD